MAKIDKYKVFLFPKIFIIQLLLNIKKNISLVIFILIFIKLSLIVTFLGTWNIFSDKQKAVILLIYCSAAAGLAFKKIKKIKFVGIRRSILWIENMNSNNSNPITASLDNPGTVKFDKKKWDLHKRNNLKKLENIRIFYPKLEIDHADPLKIRYLLLLFLFITIFIAYSNNTLKNNFLSLFTYEFYNKSEFEISISAWTDPPEYTDLGKKEIIIDLKKNIEKKLYLPTGTKINFKIYSNRDNFFLVNKDKKKPFNVLDKYNFDSSYLIKKNEKITIEDKNQIIKKFSMNVIKDKKPKVKWLSVPEIVNRTSLKFTSKAEDDYGINRIILSIEKPSEFKYIQDKSIKYNLPVKDLSFTKNMENFFYKNLAELIWAGYSSNIRLKVYDELNQRAQLVKKIKLPRKDFNNAVAKKIILIRKNIALQKIDLESASNEIEKILSNEEENVGNLSIKEKKEKLILQINKLKMLPIEVNHSLYKNLWEIALEIEEGSSFITKNELLEAEKDLFDSINRKDTDKYNLSVNKIQDSLKNLFDLNREYNDANKHIKNNDKDLRAEIDKLTQELEDLLRTGSRKNIDEKVQKLKQLTESLRNPNPIDNKELLKREKKEEIINKLSELLNKQEIIMEESFNRAADRGKFKQSSAGSGGKSPKEMQDELRNTLGNVIREIGQSENEIPQELGRADRAMRQASRDLEGGRPDMASSAQGRAIELIQRSIKRINTNMSSSFAQEKQGKENQENPISKSNFSGEEDFEYQGTSTGGRLNIPRETRLQKSKVIAGELYERYNEDTRDKEEKKYIKKLLDWY